MPAPLDVRKVLLGAFAVPWTGRNAFARHLSIPFVVLVILGILESSALVLDAGWIFLWTVLVAHLWAWIVFAVICHRLVLLGPAALGRVAPLRWSMRETRFLLRSAAVWLIAMAITGTCMAAIAFGGVPMFRETDAPWRTWLLVFLSMLPACYLVARLSLVLPAAALDRKVGLGWAWNLSSGNSARLFLVIGLLPWIFSAPAYLLDVPAGSAAASVGVTILGTLLLTVEISALSLSYRELTKDELSTSLPPPASPRTA